VNSTELKDYFRTQLRDLAQPYLWSDDEIYAYMNDAQLMFCRLSSFVIPDITSAVTDLTITAGDAYSSISTSIQQIRSAVLKSNNRKLQIISPEDTDKLVSVDYGYYSAMVDDTTSGPVTAMVIGIEPGLVRWSKVPLEDDEVKLSVYRLPSSAITTDGQTLDVPEMHHLHLISWMRYLAYQKQDADTYDPKASLTAAEAFQRYCDQTRKEWDRARHKHRTVSYGGI
jgi:hypothetical protein